jgi:hypothetical protein
MNSVAPSWRARSSSPACSPAGTVTGTVSPRRSTAAGRSRS